MKTLKKLLLIFLGLMLIFFLFLLWYQWQYAMDEVSSYEVNSPDYKKHLLIATQGSDFKDMVTNEIVETYKEDSVYIKVIDVSALENIDANDFNAIVILHTWENWQPPKPVANFIKNSDTIADKIIVLTTSGDGNYKMDEVDAITGESIVMDAPLFADKIIKKTNPLLGFKTDR
ncbi:hypothetical protein ACOCEA_17680 [Maribacter sp. CXY002]|uniref:hypothetical protein n=1 Tax=Maribacter luteocoastalis TaxID=3407671 RepID=UPI003B676914